MLGELLATTGEGEKAEPTAEQLLHEARAKIAARRRRQELFPGIQVADPAWDLLLELFVHRCEGRRISVTGLGLSANVPGATVLRWLAMFHDSGLIVREPDPQDRRRIWVHLTDEGRDRVVKALVVMLAPEQRETFRLPDRKSVV